MTKPRTTTGAGVHVDNPPVTQDGNVTRDNTSPQGRSMLAASRVYVAVLRQHWL